ncbi:hypothetical protein [Labedaea rhizosphaerae]|uniref:Uncharacterized protein n=1 Tax=Labedaea rhizosphaerae TaxID=598644 RepID=A0A4R6S965_LABRH|nr:hypothetical protein [Labedaea rhizosphaerae]TDP96539.1 hypothetical protein EV186_104527 [Labedaea rhizosphaerae]
MMWLRIALTTLVLAAVTWLGVALNVFHVGGGTLLIWLSALLVLVLPPIVARSAGVAVLGVFAAGIHLVMIFGAGLTVVDGLVLQTRGVHVQAAVTGYTDHWTAAQFTPPSKYTKNALVVVTPDGQHGIVAVDGDRPGASVEVVEDPQAAVDLHRPDEVDFTVGLVVGLIDLLMIFGLACYAGRTARKGRVSPSGKAPTST